MDSSSTPNRVSFENNRDVGDGEEQELNTPDSRGKRKESPGANGAELNAMKAPKTLPTRSKIWEHYTRTKENRDKCICHYCKKKFCCKTKSGTSNLLKHISICKQFHSYSDGQSSTQQLMDEEGNLMTAKVSDKTYKEATNEMMVIGELPLCWVDSVAWKHFCKKMNLDKPVSRRTSRRDIVKMYLERKAAMKKWFVANKQRVSLTTDIWEAKITRASYMVVTAHYIDECWRLKKLIIGFKHVSDHKGQTISRVLLDVLADWGIEKLFCVTVDNATANSSALRRFHSQFSLLSDDSLVLDGEFLHMRCSAHIINLIVKDGFTDVDQSVDAVRNAVVYVRGSGNRLISFEQKVESGRMTRGSLPLDVTTRWNSTYLMLSTALKFRAAFEKMEAEDKLYNDYFLEVVDKGRKRAGPPQYTDWKAIERLGRFLVIFYNSTLIPPTLWI
ncbi:hypothetical protein N665_0136s0010 [Sinapis alba]|nr:hypothetical protein N665_0136s0010 [Sinapis alba]